MGVLPIAQAGYNILGKGIGIIGSIGSGLGPSDRFKADQLQSDDFFAKRNYIFSILPTLTEEQRAKWETMSFLKTDFNTRRETAAERAELDAYIDWLQSGGGQTTPLLAGIAGNPSGVWLIIGGIVVLALFLSRKAG